MPQPVGAGQAGGVERNRSVVDGDDLRAEAVRGLGHDVRARLEHYVAGARTLRRRLTGHPLVALLDDELTAYLTEPERSASVSARPIRR